ncbi:MAG: TRAP transporter small permease [Hyphomicrobiales bacterium]|nr:TRAP transporter small permease [Hyphomicrobiales bacterium]
MVVLMRVFAGLGGAAVLLMMLHIVADVTGRLFFDRPLFGTTEIISNYYMVMVIFLPLALMTRREGHMTVDLFTQGLGPRSMARLETFIGLATTALLLWFCWETAHEAIESTEVREKLEAGAELFAIWPSRWLLPIGLGALAIQQVLKLIDDIRVGFLGLDPKARTLDGTTG